MELKKFSPSIAPTDNRWMHWQASTPKKMPKALKLVLGGSGAMPAIQAPAY